MFINNSNTEHCDVLYEQDKALKEFRGGRNDFIAKPYAGSRGFS